MVCPFRIDRVASPLVPGELTDRFMPCMKENCPCYRAEGDELWCYRDLIKHPLNEKAREHLG